MAHGLRNLYSATALTNRCRLYIPSRALCRRPSGVACEWNDKQALGGDRGQWTGRQNATTEGRNGHEIGIARKEGHFRTSLPLVTMKMDSLFVCIDLGSRARRCGSAHKTSRWVLHSLESNVAQLRARIFRTRVTFTPPGGEATRVLTGRGTRTKSRSVAEGEL